MSRCEFTELVNGAIPKWSGLATTFVALRDFTRADVRFGVKSRHQRMSASCPLCAKSRHE